MNKSLIFILLAGLLASCDEAATYKKQTVDGIQYVAIGSDGDGCMRYQIKSTSQMSVQVVLYKTIDGGYTPNKKMSLCFL
ncbi:MAG: hypothetical protein ISR69_14270 [Gammaproteobacteria bacterium]|nr:hypothetical protein [Gammaproteobacteria bacterium]